MDPLLRAWSAQWSGEVYAKVSVGNGESSSTHGLVE
jgi:hypothetical protein